MLRTFGLVLAAAVLLGPHVASAQPIGTFRWQLTPYCNVVALDVIQEGSVFRLQGTDDECGQSAAGLPS